VLKLKKKNSGAKRLIDLNVVPVKQMTVLIAYHEELTVSQVAKKFPVFYGT